MISLTTFHPRPANPGLLGRLDPHPPLQPGLAVGLLNRHGVEVAQALPAGPVTESAATYRRISVNVPRRSV